MITISAIKIQDGKFSSLGLPKMTVNKEQVATYSRSLGSASDANPVLVLVHGYPESAYEWRHLVPLLPSDAPIFVADLPGYGGSAAIEQNDKLTVGTVVLEALKTEVKRTSSNASSEEDIPIILIGHDRGARISHHLTVEGVNGISIRGVCLIDIVPTSTQWQNLQNPQTQAKHITGYFHWPFLANTSLSFRMISAFGRGAWCTEMMHSWAGHNTTGLQKLKSDDALEVYAAFMEQEHTLRASCEDYAHGATTDVEREQGWVKEGRKIRVPLLLVWSEEYIGKRYDFEQVWKGWVDEGVQVSMHALGGGVGHFGPEEAPEESAEVIGKWLRGL